MKAKISLIQFDSRYKRVDENIARMADMLDEAGKDKPDIIVMPELWTTGYSTELFHDPVPYAQTSCGPAIRMVQQKASLYHTWVVAGSILEKAEDGFFNTAFLIDRQGVLVGKYNKMHMYSAMDEHKLNNGCDMPVFDTDFGRIAIMTCYDIRFTEMSRAYALKGAEIIVVVSNWAAPKLNHWRVMLQARAIENQLAVAACNRVGSALEYNYFGHSLIADPWGEIVLEDTGGEEKILSGELDLSKIWDVRKNIPMYSDRHPECYPEILMRNYGGGPGVNALTEER